MKKRYQILLKKEILSATFNSFKSKSGNRYHYPVKIGREIFELVGTTDEGHLVADRDVVIGAKQAQTGAFVVINDLPFYVVNGESRMVILRLLCAKIPNKNNNEVDFLFDKDLSRAEKKSILGNYPVNSEIIIEGVTFMVTKSNNEEISLIPIEKPEKSTLPIEDWDISAKLFYCLKEIKIKNLSDLLSCNESNLKKIKSTGKKCMMELRAFLKSKDVYFPEYE